MPSRNCQPKIIASTFVVLTFLFSCPVWFLIGHLPPSKAALPYVVVAMWCPALAAVVTRLWHQRNLQGFGLTAVKPGWLLLALLLPIIAGLLIFGAAWITGAAPFNPAKWQIVARPAFIPKFFIGLGFACVAALGEELGWRGLLVPELARVMSYTGLAFVSGVIWLTWHIPLLIFGRYHGADGVWLSLAALAPVVIGASFMQAWMRLASGSVWVAMLLHGSWNYFIQAFFPLLTMKTPEGERMVGEFGWAAAAVSVIGAWIFWSLRGRLRPPTKPGCIGA